jgi:hypothetical protein
MAGFYSLKRPELPWGDYSSILMHGMSCHLGRERGRIQLERNGPYVPPISFPGIGDIVVTDSFKRKLESSGLNGLRFQPVIKKHIVHLDWHLWDRSAEEPAEYPETGEPEDYILEQPHSQETSDSMGDLWEVVLETRIIITRGQDGMGLAVEPWRGEDLFHARNVAYNCATEKAKAWFEENAGDFVTFKEVDVAR